MLLMFGCASHNGDNGGKSESGSPTVSIMRKNVNPKPVASYIVPMGDPKLERKFGVEIFETPFTYKYYMSMEYDGAIENDTLYLPQLDVAPTVVVKPGPEDLSCIIGFLDDKKVFREYKMMTTKNHQLRLKVLKSYYVSQ